MISEFLANSYPIGTEKPLVIELLGGSYLLTTHASAELEVREPDLKGRLLLPEPEDTGDYWMIGGQAPGALLAARDRVQAEIRVPEGLDVVFSVHAGSVRVRGTYRSLEVSATFGLVEAELPGLSVAGQADFRVMVGEIKLLKIKPIEIRKKSDRRMAFSAERLREFCAQVTLGEVKLVKQLKKSAWRHAA
jgi:hypothetical protein